MSRRPRLVHEGLAISPESGTNCKDYDYDYDNCQSHKYVSNVGSQQFSKHGINTQHQERQYGQRSFISASDSSFSSSLHKASQRKASSGLQFEIKGHGNRNDVFMRENTHTKNMDISHPKQIHGTECSAMETEESAFYDNSISQSTRTSVILQKEFSQTRNTRHKMPTYFVVGGSCNENQQEDSTDATTRMEIDDILPKPPLIVVDGANVAYAYAKAFGLNGANSSLQGGIEPDAQGIHICASYFANAGCRVQVVLPVHWMRKKSQGENHDLNRNAHTIIPQVDILQNLKDRNILCCSPPADDDDAYVIAMARREDGRARRKNLDYMSSCSSQMDISSAGGAFVLSNDFFRDAAARDSSGELKFWLNGCNGGELSPRPPGRISYSFCNLGSINEYGDPQLDFMPNPRHVLIEAVERIYRIRSS